MAVRYFCDWCAREIDPAWTSKPGAMLILGNQMWTICTACSDQVCQWVNERQTQASEATQGPDDA